MTREEILAYEAKERAFAETELGKAFLRFKWDIQVAVRLDAEYDFLDKGNPKGLDKAWKDAETSEKLFRDKLAEAIRI